NAPCALTRDLDAGSQPARKARRGRLVPGRQAPFVSECSDIGLRESRFLKRMADPVLGGGLQAGTVIALVVEISAAANDVDTQVRKQRFDARVEFVLT